MVHTKIGDIMLRKIIYISIILLVIVPTLVFSYKDNIKPTFSDTSIVYYQKYIIPCDLIMSDYLNIFASLNNVDYQILDFKIENNYKENIQKEIENIKISKGDYLETLDNYLKEYQNILNKYDLTSELAKINAANIVIGELTIFTTIDGYNAIYDKIKKVS